MNAIEHAYGSGDAQFEVEARVEGGEVLLCVRDEGRWREPRGGDRGRGLAIIESLMDEVRVTPGRRGTTVRMRRRLGSRLAAGAGPRGAG